MNKNIRWKVLTILAVLVIFTTVGVYPILASYYGLPAPGGLKEKQLKLGLDLKGGVHLVVRVERDDALRLETETETERLREAMRTAAITGTAMAISPVQFRVDGVPQAQDQAFRQAAAAAETNFDRGTATNGSYTFTMKGSVQQSLRTEAVTQARQTIERRVNELGVAEPSIAQQGQNGDQILVQLPGVTDVERAKGIIGNPGLLELKIVEQGPFPTQEAALQAYNNALPPEMMLVPGSSDPAAGGGAPGSTVY
jgi:preprotein translocase subunit SecD